MLAALAAFVLVTAACTPSQSPQATEVTPSSPGHTAAPEDEGVECQYERWSWCPIAEWVSGALAEGGFRVVGDTGSALVAGGGGREFSVWASDRVGAEAIQREGYPFVRKVAGRKVFGGDIQYTWSVPQLQIWVAKGPTETALPHLEQLRPLIVAMRQRPYDGPKVG